MLFILTNSQDATASFLISVLEKSRIPFLRLDTDRLLPRIRLSYRLAEPAIRVDGRWYEAGDVSNIWYRRPEKLKDERFDSSPESNCTRSEWTEFIECFFAHVPEHRWINHPSRNASASRKLEQLTTAAALGFTVPDTLATQEPSELRAFYQKHGGQIITKPLSSGYIERKGEQSDSLIYTNQVRANHLDNLEELSVCPTLFQQFIHKHCDIRITILDGHAHPVALFATEESGTQRCDVRRNNMSDVVYRIIEMPSKVRTSIENLMLHYNLRFAAIDMAVTPTGEWYFFEINPNGQWAWLDQSANTNIAASFVKSFSNQQTTTSA
jgi:glutathione synthase/RimK-type ligase-like ATP-grasp enzyme